MGHIGKSVCSSGEIAGEKEEGGKGTKKVKALQCDSAL
jgi:hypothetical protein